MSVDWERRREWVKARALRGVSKLGTPKEEAEELRQNLPDEKPPSWTAIDKAIKDYGDG
jgi:hypothetical protein